MSLILHCGAHHTDRDTIMNLPQPVAQGPRHAPMHHGDFIIQVEEALARHDVGIKEAAYGITHDGARMFGLMTVEPPKGLTFKGGEFTIGLRGSHDQSLPRGLAAGTRVFVCDNLAFNGEAVMATKQTKNLWSRLPVLLDDTLRTMCERFEYNVIQFDEYRRIKLEQDQADAAILEMGRQGVINWGELGKVVQEWDTPSHDEFAEDGPSVYRLFNAATEVLKPRNPDHPRLPLLAPKTATLHRICDQLSGLPTAA